MMRLLEKVCQVNSKLIKHELHDCKENPLEALASGVFFTDQDCSSVHAFLQNLISKNPPEGLTHNIAGSQQFRQKMKREVWAPSS
jgi:hypothetical protein